MQTPPLDSADRDHARQSESSACLPILLTPFSLASWLLLYFEIYGLDGFSFTPGNTTIALVALALGYAFGTRIVRSIRRALLSLVHNLGREEQEVFRSLKMKRVANLLLICAIIALMAAIVDLFTTPPVGFALGTGFAIRTLLVDGLTDEKCEAG